MRWVPPLSVTGSSEDLVGGFDHFFNCGPWDPNWHHQDITRTWVSRCFKSPTILLEHPTAFEASALNAGLVNGSWWNELQQAVIVLNRPGDTVCDQSALCGRNRPCLILRCCLTLYVAENGAVYPKLATHPLENSHSYRKWPFIVDLSMKNDDFPKLSWFTRR